MVKDTWKKWGRRMLQIIAFLAIFYCLEKGIALLLCKEPSSWGRRILNQIYRKDSIDVCFVGGSQVLQGVACDTASELLGGDVVNVTSSQQPPAATAALVREVLKDHPEISQIYASLDYSLVMAEDVNLESIYIVADAMKPSLNKLQFLLKATPQEYYVNSFLPLRKGESYARSLAEIKGNLAALVSEEFRNRAAASGFAESEGMSEEEYASLAAEYESGSKDESLLDESGTVSLPERSLQGMQDMIAVCEKKGVELVFFATPMPQFLTESVQGYDRYVQTILSVAHAAGIPYYDYNTEASDVPAEWVTQFDRSAAANFLDEYHLSSDGARQFTRLLLQAGE